MGLEGSTPCGSLVGAFLLILETKGTSSSSSSSTIGGKIIFLFFIKALVVLVDGAKHFHVGFLDTVGNLTFVCLTPASGAASFNCELSGLGGAWGVRSWEKKMGEMSHEWGNLFPKSRYIMETVKEFREKLDLVGKGLDQVGKRLDIVRKNTQSVNVKVEALSKGKEERPKLASNHESEESFEEGNYSEVSRSSRFSLGERCERQGRMERNRREERKVSHWRRGEEQTEEKLDMRKYKIPPFLGNCKLKIYVDWELKVEKIVGCFSLCG
ncbi:hypothetical protein CR513_15732, partial [Mucuna pruriens]